MIDAIHEERKAENIRKQNELLLVWLQLVSMVLQSIRCSYLSDIGAYLSHAGEEQETDHPFFMTQSRLSRKVMSVLDQSLQNVFETRIRALPIDQLHIVRNVVDGKVFQGRDFDL